MDYDKPNYNWCAATDTTIRFLHGRDRLFRVYRPIPLKSVQRIEFTVTENFSAQDGRFVTPELPCIDAAKK